MLTTERIQEKSYELKVGARSFSITTYHYPLPGCGNYTAVEKSVKVTPKRARLTIVGFANNWNGSGRQFEQNEVYDRDCAVELLEAAKLVEAEIEAEEDEDDRELLAYERISELLSRI